MESLEELHGSLVAIDTAPLIYFLEKHQPWVQRVKLFFQALDSGSFQAVTSTLTLSEVLTQPLRHARADLAQQYRRILLHSRNLKMLPVNEEIAERAAGLRALYNLRTPTRFSSQQRSIPELDGCSRTIRKCEYPAL